jgi:hypothetical protein
MGSILREVAKFEAQQLIEKGRQQGVEQACQLAVRSLVRLLRQPFGTEMDVQAEQRIAAVSLEQHEEWQQHVLTAIMLANFFWADVTTPKAEEVVMTAGQQVIEDGRQLGLQDGRQESRLGIMPEVRCWLQQWFGNEAVAHAEQRIADASNEQLEQWLDRLLSVATLEKVLADMASGDA